MTRSIQAANHEALKSRRLESRGFVWFVVRDRASGAPVYDGYWSDSGTIDAEVIDPLTGGIVTRQLVGANTLIAISDVALVSTITVQTVTVTLSQCADRVIDLVQRYQCKQGRIEVHRALFDPDTRLQVAPAEPRFVGFIDDIDVVTAAENQDGGVTLRCVSHTQEMTRSNPDTCCDASQRLRDPDDEFCVDMATVGEWRMEWGSAGGAVVSAPSVRPRV